ncbi:mediator of RNA polymerase II transcription subunit 17 [Trichonephila inaurata madagascariensis]|uniref:Mediator of RNA polymerase II transcription subunit 17 n=1 Tax=Trichonephila inaurata madagascariensis TaxID=2747483 RepID=A0A8X6YGN9_9ARAC|nr:mediator of RNA polymerase II transcription subunit 17 [Trichonephila inaurata madagascariensis]
MSGNVCIEAQQEYLVQEITYDGQEIYTQPLSMSENLTRLAHKIDFVKTDSDQQTTSDSTEEESKELATFQASLWPWDSALANAASILMRGSERLRESQSEPIRTRPLSDFHLELLHMRQTWRLKKVGNTILGDLSFRSENVDVKCAKNTEVSLNEDHSMCIHRTMMIIDTFACEIKDPLIVAHWLCLSSPTLSSVKINIMTLGYETMCRTPLVIHVEEKSLKAICRDGRTMSLSYEPEELRYLLMCQASQHQVNAAQALAKLMGWKVLSSGINLGVGNVEPTGNACSVLMTSPAGDRVIALRCSPKNGIHVSVSFSPQTTDFYPSTLVRDRKWQNLAGSFREVTLEKMEGRNFLNKLEHLMASLTPC